MQNCDDFETFVDKNDTNGNFSNAHSSPSFCIFLF